MSAAPKVRIRFVSAIEQDFDLPLPIDRARRVAVHGLTPGIGKHAGPESYAEILDAESRELIETITVDRVCRHCGAPLERNGDLWVDATIDGTFDICPATYDEASDTQGKHSTAPDSIVDGTGRTWTWSHVWGGYRAPGMVTHGIETIRSQWGEARA